MQGESLRRLDANDPAMTDREAMRQQIEGHVAEYLARGGTIHQVTSDDNRRHDWSPKSLQHRQARLESAGRYFNAGPRDKSC